MFAAKKRQIGIILLFIIVASGVFCICTAWGNSSGLADSTDKTEQHGTSPSGEVGRPPGGPNNNPDGGFPEPNRNQHGFPPNRSVSEEIPGARFDVEITAYAVIFLALFIAAYFILTNGKAKIHPGHAKILMIVLMCAGMLLRISSSTLIDGHPFDINIFKGWADAAAGNLFQFYSGPRPSDYPPLYIYILFMIGKISGYSAFSPYTILLLKLPSILADIAVSLLIYRLAKKHLSLEMSVLLSAFYIFNPAVIINSTLWGQVDSLFTLIVVASMMALTEKKIGLSSALFMAAVLMKPQGLIFLPVLFFAVMSERSLKSLLKASVSALITAAVIILPFSLHQDVLWIFRLYARTVGEYPYASVNAFNFFSLVGQNYVRAADTFFIFSYKSWGLIFIIIITALSWLIYIKGNSRNYAFATALLIIAGVFTFSTSMHERYLFPAAALSVLTFIYLGDKRLLLLSAGFSATIFVNTHVVLSETLKGINSISYCPILIATSLLNVILFIYLIMILFSNTSIKYISTLTNKNIKKGNIETANIRDIL